MLLFADVVVKDDVMTAWKKHEVPGKGGIDKNALHLLLNELGFFQGLDVQKQQQVILHCFYIFASLRL